MPCIKLAGWYEPDLHGLLCRSPTVSHTVWFLYKPAEEGESMGFEEAVKLWKAETSFLTPQKRQGGEQQWEKEKERRNKK